MDNTPKSVLRWLIGLPVRLLAVLCLTGILLVAGLHVHSSFVADGVMRLLLLVLLAGYTWAVYYGRHFFSNAPAGNGF
jgi:hypothetical protein